MCKNQCGILVNQEGDAVKVSANRNHPQAGICGRGAAAPYILNHPDRLKGPMVRRGGVYLSRPTGRLPSGRRSRP